MSKELSGPEQSDSRRYPNVCHDCPALRRRSIVRVTGAMIDLDFDHGIQELNRKMRWWHFREKRIQEYLSARYYWLRQQMNTYVDEILDASLSELNREAGEVDCPGAYYTSESDTAICGIMGAIELDYEMYSRREKGSDPNRS